MSHLSSFRRAAITAVCFVLLGPPLAFEVFYRICLFQVPTPVLPPSRAPTLVLQTLSIAMGELRDDGWDWPWLETWLVRPSRRTSISRAASEVARLWLARQPLPDNRADRRLIEAAVAVWLTRHASVVQLQQALAEWEDFGRGAVGISAASAAYFGSARRSLQVQQVALLAGILQYPMSYSFCPPSEALTRRALMLGQMVGAQLISAAEAETAARKPLGVVLSESCSVPDNGT